MEKNIRDLLIDELKDVLSAEEQIVDALPKMVSAAESPELKNAFETHLKETRVQVSRLNKIFRILKENGTPKFCKGMRGLIDECKEAIEEFEKSPLRDAALISKAQRIEHYEISAYGTMRTFAKELGLGEVTTLLDETLEEEGNADKLLTKIAEGGFFTSGVNEQANIQEDEEEDNNRKQVRKKARPHKNVRKVTRSKVRKVSRGKAKKVGATSFKAKANKKKRASAKRTVSAR